MLDVVRNQCTVTYMEGVRFEMRVSDELIARIDVDRQRSPKPKSRALWLRDAAELVLSDPKTPTEQELFDAMKDAQKHGATMAERIFREALAMKVRGRDA